METSVIIFMAAFGGVIVIGLVRPRIILPILKWEFNLFGKMLGADITPKSDESLMKKIRIWHSVLLVVFSIVLFNVIKNAV